MLKSTFKLTDSLDYVRYGRMSDDSQNPLSPDQQFAEIDREIQRRRLPWKCVGTYRDDAVKGGYISKRPGFMRMLRDIRIGSVKPRVVLVHTAERFGRAEEIPGIRLELQSKYGVLLLTADSGFTDPSTTAGRAVQFVEQIRSTTGNEVKAHDVLRGKLDVVRRKLWPGGPAPLGYRLDKTISDVGGRQVTESRLVPDPQSAIVPRKAFALADATGRGSTAIACMLNDDPEVPDQFKPVRHDTISYILDNPIYGGTLRFNRVCTGIVADTRRQQRNADEEVVCIENFSEPLIDPVVVARVREVRKRRRLQRAAARGDNGHKGPVGVGLVLKYPLTGLVYCRECGSRMTASISSGRIKPKYRKLYYRCPLAASRACANKRFTRGDLLWACVTASLRRRLFPPPSSEAEIPEWVPSMVAAVRAAAADLSAQTPQHADSLRAERQALREQMQGWQMSLGNPRLSGGMRQDIEERYQQALDRVGELDQKLTSLQQRERCVEEVVDAKRVLQKLQILDEVLGRGNPSDINFELSLHIDGIDVGADGTVIMRTCKLGCFEGASELLAVADQQEGSMGNGTGVIAGHRVRNRRRGQLRLADPDLLGNPQAHEQNFVATADRFEGLEDQWFWEEQLPMTRQVSWTRRHAAEVAALRASDRKAWSLQKLANHFGVSKPTISAALRHHKMGEPSGRGTSDGPAR
jgi:DNA invertase Pin-like site-specific DNA recombinase